MAASNPTCPRPFSLSLADLAARAEGLGWGFWRGYLLGALSTAVVVYWPGWFMFS